MKSTFNQIGKIIDESVSYISKNGLQNASLRGLADGIGTSGRMLIHYFGSSEKLFDIVLKKFVESEKERATALVEKALSTAKPVQDFLYGYIDHLAKKRNSGIVNTIFQMYGSTILGDQSAREHLRVLLEHWSAEIKRLPLPRDMNPTVLIAFANGLVFDMLALRDDARIEQAIRSFLSKHLGV